MPSGVLLALAAPGVVMVLIAAEPGAWLPWVIAIVYLLVPGGVWACFNGDII